MSQLTPFHVAVPVHDLEQCLQFYQDCFHCSVGRRAEHWIDLNLYGHQWVLHYDESLTQRAEATNPVDGKQVPVPHFGVILTMEQWEVLAERLQSLKVDFVIEPYVRFRGQPGEQATLFIRDPAGNALEFKAFRDFGQIFAT